MPVYSMTGYASGQNGARRQPRRQPRRGPRPRAGSGLEIRSVNSRFLDLTLRLPEELRQHEPALRELLTAQAQARQGRSCAPRIESAARRRPARAVGRACCSGSTRVQDTVQRLAAGRPRPERGRRAAPGRRRQRSATATGAPTWPNWPRKALDALLSARAREGARLATMLLDHLAQLRELAAQAEPLVPQLVEQQRARFLERWQEAMAPGRRRRPCPKRRRTAP